MDLTAGMKADCLVSNTLSHDRIQETYLSAISSRLLQWGCFQFPQASGTDTLTTRLFLGRQRCFLQRLCRSLERAIRNQTVGNVLFACLRHGDVVIPFVVVVFGTAALM